MGKGETMSVPTSKRGKGNLVVFTKLRQLCDYTQAIVNNRKYFPMEEVVLKNGKKALNNVKPILAKNIYEKTCAIENYSTRANKVFVKSGDDMRLRREFWSKAIAETSALLKDMEKAMVLCDIPSKVMNFWTGQVKAIQDLLMNRRNTEHKTYMG